MSKMILLSFLMVWFSGKGNDDQKIVEVGIHHTIETFMILRSLAHNDPLFQYRDSTYLGKPIMYEARKTFAQYRNHKAVKETQKLLEATSSTGDLILQGLLYFEELPSQSLKYKITSEHWRGRQDTLINYMNVLHQFYIDAKVGAFISHQSNFYAGAISEAKSHLRDDLITTMEGYFGIKNRAYKMILIPNSPFGMGFGASVKTNTGDIFYQIISPCNDVAWNSSAIYNTYGFSGDGSEEYYRDLVVHEFCHPFITPFIENENWRKVIAKTDSLYVPELDSLMSRQGYGSWWGFVNEHLVRVVEIRIAKKMDEQSLGEMRAYNIKECGFVLLPEAEKLMELYESNRNKYATIESFIPQLVEQLNMYSEADMNKKLRGLNE